MSDSSRACDHTRGMARSRSTALTVCHDCRDYLCSICGVTRDDPHWLMGRGPICPTERK